MLLASLVTQSFRNLSVPHACFQPGLNIFFGDNGQGKTNVLEAIYLLASSKSFRAHHLNECLRHGAERFTVCGAVHGRQAERDLAVSWSSGQKSLSVNGKTVPVVRYLGNLDALLISFDQLPVVRGSPDERRRFLDRGIMQLKKTYLEMLAEFHRALRQRNRLLALIREGQAHPSELEPWEKIYAERAVSVSRERARYVLRLQEELPRVGFFPDSIQLIYVPSVLDQDPQAFCRRLAAMRAEELSAGRSIKGPHRDDLRILIEQKEIQKFGSGGQQRSAVFALILAAMKLYFIENNDYPVLLIDDLDAELDVVRLEALLGCLETANQVFVSCAKKTILGSISYCTKWEVQEGVLGGA